MERALEDNAKNLGGVQLSWRLRIYDGAHYEVSRIEGFSDAVFGFAITLLVVSLEVPKTSTELLGMMRGFVAFALCFFLLFQVWFHQYKFFRRYGLQDNYILWLNAFLLFVILFFVYPLKFLVGYTINQFTDIGINVRMPDGTFEPAIKASHVPTLMSIYGLGFAAVFCAFALLNYHAYRKRVELELNELEVFDTRISIQQNVLNALIALVSILIALVSEPRNAGMAGIAYFLIFPALLIHNRIMGSRRRRLKQRCDELPMTA
jgi:uncharacterized membrane protein